MHSTPAADDYYALLGIHAGADDAELRQAWRLLAARWHPDRAGAGATATFQQISAAYTVLSDPVARAAYDRRRRGRSPAERPKSARAAATPSGSARRSPPAVMLSRLCGPLSSLIRRGAAALDDDDDGLIALILSQAEAAQGGMAMVSMPVAIRCPDCAAKGQPAGGCARCGGRGMVQELFSAWLGVPPGVQSGEMLTPSAELPGMVERIRFRVTMRQ